MNWWILGPLVAFLFAWFLAAFMIAMHALNPDPGWRAREAEIRRLEQEERLRYLRGHLHCSSGYVHYSEGDPDNPPPNPFTGQRWDRRDGSVMVWDGACWVYPR